MGVHWLNLYHIIRKWTALAERYEEGKAVNDCFWHEFKKRARDHD